MKKIKLILSASAISLLFVSCNNYLDINEDPNNIHVENLTPELILPGVITEMYRVQSGDEMQLGSLMMNNWAANTYTYGNPYGAEFTLSAVNSKFYDGIWDSTYKNLYNFKIIEDYANADHKQDNYIAVAKILKAFYMQTIVDLYGDVPYSDAWKGYNNATPKYDNDEEVYKALFNSLDDGIAIIDEENEHAEDITSVDIVFGGDMQKWKAFANTIKLRYLVRMAKTTGAMATFRDEKLAELAGSNPAFITDNVFEKPGYSTANNDALNPLIFNYRADSGGNDVQNFKVITVSEHFANVLEGNAILNSSDYAKYTGIKDPRRYSYFTRVAAYNRLKGIRQGATAGQPGAELDPTNPASRLVSSFATPTFTGSATGGLFALGNARGGSLMTLAEANFLMAEAALRWPSLFSFSAQDKFNSGVTSSIAYFGGTGAAAYVTSISSVPGLGWAGSNEQKLEAIITQKWLALSHVNAIETFIEYNRTGYPFTPLATTAIMSNKPYRLQYPQSEFSANSANTPNIPTGSLFTKNQYTPFWNQN
ncbi:SusD/RagB family nutrient-binding outer membrane lipoprotein [Chryseobacterium sp. NRRL B-14859]|uniref:SusD/RagB family nutrient-binding outer membrane lipoprotein n=1 Tax=Chryseobacterium sp. NRRL B-14859 TaxID=1562763 RepID=UPI003399696A